MSLFGILSVHKPPGCTSRDVVNRIQRIVRPVRCGHAGTLDPLASGVLVICVGPATRLIQYIQRMPKSYRATFLLGRSSPTDDVEGEVTSLAAAPVPPRDAIEAALPRFLGQIEQRPPEFSAIRVGGRRAYALARRGIAVELPCRTVTVYQLAVERYEYPELTLTVECGSGTYVRALGRDLAAALGTAAVLAALERTSIGSFTLENALSLDPLDNRDDLAQRLQPPLLAVSDLPRIALSDAQQTEIRHGRSIAKPVDATLSPKSASAAETTQWAAVDGAGRLIAILEEKRTGELWPVINLC